MTDVPTLIRVEGRPEPVNAADLKSPPPQDRRFRGAWTLEGASIKVDMAKAFPIAQDHVRQARAAKFPALDGAVARAEDAGDATARKAAAAKRQQLRDAPADPRLAAAATPEALKAAMEAIKAEIAAL